jgi:sigma-B regulation protein RsbU (phosphoserine phosphatase)
MSEYRLACSEIWGGTGPANEDVATSGVTASIYSAAAGGGRGGDIHYLSACSHDLRTRIAVADVRGHGESVALVSSWVYAVLRAQVNEVTGDQLLSELNGQIYARGIEAMTTAAILGYDGTHTCLYFCYAGHPPAMVWRPAEGWRRLENCAEGDASNRPLGVLPSTEYEQGRVSLSPGDRVLLYTDGLLDAEDRDGEPFGAERLLRLLGTEGDTSVSAVKRLVVDGVLEHTKGAPLVDDLTVLAAQIR